MNYYMLCIMNTTWIIGTRCVSSRSPPQGWCHLHPSAFRLARKQNTLQVNLVNKELVFHGCGGFKNPPQLTLKE